MRIYKHAYLMALIMPSLLMGAGCSWTQTPAPVVAYGAASGVGNTGAHTVAQDDTLWNIAQRYKISLQDLIRTNHLAAPYNLRAGQRLILPPPQTYRVRANDSLYTISRLFDISTTELARLNDLRAPYTVHAGQDLRLPSLKPATAPRTATARAAASPSMPQVSVGTVDSAHLPPPAQGGAYQGGIHQGGTYQGGTHQGSGQRQLAWGGPLPAGADNVPRMPPSPAPSGPESTLSVGQIDTVASAPSAAQPSAPLAGNFAHAPRTNGRFEWPVAGRVISSYGPKTGGEHNDGINLAAARGTPIYAAENGTVVYASNEMRGFGNLVLVRHADRWMTVYAHMDRILVQKGAKVTRGQPIGTIGSTGNVAEPQLHFEVRRGTEALNPEMYLARRGS